ncbi:MAG: oxygen-independent coproporphyrinogen oxidase [Thermotogaceae bacterium]|jgi:oxygen-independent coproporphyrinogen-3 oxidase|nr:oxygen-independent coproporphyrinogen oxidase [Thermotogaceae bacterium]
MDNNNSISLYIHIPFCVSKCAYCDFTSFPISQNSNQRFSDYFSALNHELMYLIKHHLSPSYSLSSLYIGGGTPSVVPFKYYKPLLEKVLHQFNHPAEFTCEVNPGSVSREFLHGLKDYGCTRISMGMQSPNDDTLEIVNRHQTLSRFIQAYSKIRALFSNVNIDLICGLPESLQEWFEKSGDLVAKLAPEHCSIYILETEKETPLGNQVRNGAIVLPTFEYTTEIFELMIWRLKNAGYRQYEISNFSLPGCESIHNHCYWETKNYLGLGVSAGGYFNGFRYVNTHSLSEYLNADFENESHYDYHSVNSAEENLREFLFMGLRLKEGIFLDELNAKFPDASVEKMINVLSGSKYMIFSNGYLRLNDYYFIHNREAFEYLLDVL